MATENTKATLDGMFKEVYGELEDARPRWSMITDAIPFRRRDKLGDSFHFPVVLTREHGVTFAGGATAGTAFALKEAEAAVSKDAQISGSEFVGRGKLAYGAASSAVSKGKAAFVDATEHLTTNLYESAHFYLELEMIYGQVGFAQIESVSGASTTRDWVINKATFAPGVWSQFVNGYLDAYDDEDLTTLQNTNADIQVTAVDVSTRTVSVSGNATDLTAIAANEWLVPRGWKTNSFAGMIKIFKNAGSLFNISAATYPLWKTVPYSASSAALTLGKVQAGLTNSVGQGLMDDIKLCVSPYTWADLNTDHAALRRLAETTKTDLDLGTQGITYYGTNGTVEIKSHPMLYAGRGLGFVPKHFKRIGSSDVTFNLPNHPQGRFFRELTSSAGYELRVWFDQATICTRPAQQLYITDIVNDSF